MNYFEYFRTSNFRSSRLFLAILAVSVLSCTRDASKPNVELMQGMMENPAVKAQEYDESSPGHSGMRVPPEHTVPQGFRPYKCAGDYECSKGLKNPLTDKMTDSDMLFTGQKFFETNCAICHGSHGAGDGPIASKLILKAPPLVSDKVKGWTDGEIYHLITEGRGLMGAYASHIPQQYRWQVVNYIRFLQQKSK